MKNVILIIATIFIIQVSNAQTDSLYLGQTPPGTTPTKFNIPYRSGDKASECIAITPDGKEIYYGETTNGNTHYWIKHFIYSNGAWSDTSVLFDGYTGPALSPGGDTLFFHQYLNGFSGTGYFSVRNDTGWSAPTIFAPGIHMTYLQMTNSGNYYLIRQGAPNYISKMVISTSDTAFINLGLGNQSFSISRDESFIIFQSANGEFGNYDLFISYRKNDDSWTNPKNLGTPINTNDYEVEPYVTADNKYLFFMRAIPSQLIYWVRIDNLIDSLKHTNFIPYVKNSIPDLIAIKDSSFIYQIADTTFIDDDGNNTLTYTATLSNGNSLPEWLSFDSLTCTFSGTPLTATSAIRPIAIKVIATDTAHASCSCIFNFSVANPAGVEKEKNQHPEESTLFQNYPNPFNPTTTIHYSLSKSSFVKLTIYNILGQKIRTLQNAFQTAGEHSLLWDATDDHNNPVSSGLYFYSLEMNNQTLQKKMLLVK